jgi:hypothetical protein
LSDWSDDRRHSGSNEESGRSNQPRLPSRQHINFRDVNFDPNSNNIPTHNNLMELLKRPDRPYEQSHKTRKGSISQSHHTDATLTIEEEEDDDDSFVYSPGNNAYKPTMSQYAMDDVVEEEDETVIQRYDQPRAPPRQYPHSMAVKPNSFKNKLKPVSFHIRAKRQTTPLNSSRESQDTEGTIMSTDDEYEKSPLFVDRAANSLLSHQKYNQVKSGQKKSYVKDKLRLSRFLHR